jgi:hypothetical protein
MPQVPNKHGGLYEKLLYEYRDKGLDNVSEFLENIGRRSKSSVIGYSSGLDHFSRFIKKKYKW